MYWFLVRIAQTLITEYIEPRAVMTSPWGVTPFMLFVKWTL
jgi:hypothetical protein